MRTINQALVTRVGMRGCHKALLYAERVVKDLDHRHETVRGARRVRDDVVPFWVVVVVVHPDHESCVAIA